jgi:hypothetical protein
MAKKYNYFFGLSGHKKNQMFNNFALGLVITLGFCHLVELIFFDHASGGLILMRAAQYAGMGFVISIPRMLRNRWRFDVPPLISIFIILYCICSLILGDGLDLNGRIGWWDELVLIETGLLLPLILLWQIHVAMHLWSEYIHLHRCLIALIVVFFSVGAGACWEVIEYYYFTLFDPEHITNYPVYADAMTDILLLLVCASAIAIYGLVRHNALVERYRPQPAPVKGLVN